jgi:hypothetical protein
VRNPHWATPAIPAIMLIVGILALPIAQLGGLAMMPGGIGDARLNNYFLENFYRFLAGDSESLWHLPFFYPFPYVLGFSDNLFGSAPIYALVRTAGARADTAYQIWFFVGYALNFIAAYYGLRRLGRAPIAASVGALIFAFALPTTGHADHAQLHYRFALALALTFFVEFLDRKDWASLTLSAAWLVWQFYCGIYMGFFCLLLLGGAAICYVGFEAVNVGLSAKRLAIPFVATWQDQTQKRKLIIAGTAAASLAAMLLLFYPYAQVSHLYGAERSWAEIATMLPRPQSYLLSDASYLWSAPKSGLFAALPMRHEHQMFVGLVPLLLAFFGLLHGVRSADSRAVVIFAGSLAFVIIMTLYVKGVSLWYLLHALPLASAIRAVTRLDQAVLFPIAYLGAVAIDELRSRAPWGAKVVWIIVLPPLVLEFSATSMPRSAKAAWRQRLADVEKVFPKDVSKESVVFLAQRRGPAYADELDAMWVALISGSKTINGYSGLFPPGASPVFGGDCSELPKRLVSYLQFIGRSDDVIGYRNLIHRATPIGFTGCDERWWKTPPNITRARRMYTADEFRHLSYRLDEESLGEGRKVVYLIIRNSLERPFAAVSALGKPIRISWRFVDATGRPTSGWDTRRDLPFDIPANGQLSVLIPLSPDSGIKGGSLEVSLVQELVFWGHDIGIPPATIRWD